MGAFELNGIRRGPASAIDPGGYLSAISQVRQVAVANGWQPVEGLFAAAQSMGTTRQDVYEQLRDEILRDLANSMPVSAVVLLLHGAMTSDSCEDCDGDLIERVRSIVGCGVPIGVELDLHCNITQRMLKDADILIAYKEYPHTDIDECAAQVTRLTLDAAQGRIRPTLALYDCRMTGTWHTTREPMRSLVNHMKGLEGIGGVLTVSLAHGFDFADVTESGTKAWAITNNDPELAQNIAADIGRRLWEIRQSINTPLLTMDAALHEVENLSIPGQSADVGPIVIADMADNPGGGARADSTFALEGLHRRGMGNIALGGLWDPGAVQICLEAGEGAWLNLRLGGKSGATSGQPLDLRVQIRAIKTDHFQTAFGARTQLGPSAWVVSEHGVDIVLISRCDQVIGTDLFTGLGIDLSTRSAVIVKSMQHFYAAFAPLARRVLYADSPGLLTSDHSHLSFKRKKLDVWPHVENPFLNST
jgi:microcystin degradation protein MlrC